MVVLALTRLEVMFFSGPTFYGPPVQADGLVYSLIPPLVCELKVQSACCIPPLCARGNGKPPQRIRRVAQAAFAESDKVQPVGSSDVSIRRAGLL